MKGRWIILALVGIGAIVVGLAWVFSPQEPIYRGKPLSYWLDETKGGDTEQAQAAVWNKLPARLQEMVLAPDSDYDLRLNKVPIALSLFGGAALPSLITAAQDHNVDIQFVAVRAIGMMGRGGESASPTLIPLLAQTNEFIRTTVASAIGQIGPIRTQAIPALTAALPLTAGTLGAIAPDAQAAVPALTVQLDSPK